MSTNPVGLTLFEIVKRIGQDITLVYNVRWLHLVVRSMMLAFNHIILLRAPSRAKFILVPFRH